MTTDNLILTDASEATSRTKSTRNLDLREEPVLYSEKWEYNNVHQKFWRENWWRMMGLWVSQGYIHYKNYQVLSKIEPDIGTEYTGSINNLTGVFLNRFF